MKSFLKKLDTKWNILHSWIKWSCSETRPCRCLSGLCSTQAAPLEWASLGAWARRPGPAVRGKGPCLCSTGKRRSRKSPVRKCCCWSCHDTKLGLLQFSGWIFPSSSSRWAVRAGSAGLRLLSGTAGWDSPWDRGGISCGTTGAGSVSLPAHVAGFVQNTESQNGRGWKGPLWVI